MPEKRWAGRFFAERMNFHIAIILRMKYTEIISVVHKVKIGLQISSSLWQLFYGNEVYMIRILLIEDNEDIIKNLTELLKEEGFAAVSGRTRSEAMEILEQEQFDLVLLDLMLPDGSGYSICRYIKQEWELPVIMLTALGDEASVVTGFDQGADDYIAKPFRPLELISRVKNVLRRCGKSQSVFRISNLYVDTVKAYVSKDGREINLSSLEYRLLLVFLNHQGEVLSRNRLLEEIWDIAGDFVNDNTLTVYIKRLREKVEDDPANPVIIRTIRGQGYKIGD